ncbi:MULTISPECIES: hypothetical protein [unclassified Nocardioides]|uniref:hypothetical protein n=1 Tax=unclassified Nocardioides TaxID=2615069 RepID=UPI000A63BB5C|nr:MULTISPECIES: hypothetical protein [unclassified Nocardioides]
MNLFLTVLLVLAAAAYVAYLTAYIRNDGYGSRSSSGLPRSHPSDVFEQGARV